jgi:hypothetical protein
MEVPEQKGYMWKFYGYTKLHLWGCHIVGGILASCGAALLTASVILWNEIGDSSFQRLLLISISCFAGATAVATGSIFSLIYFRGLNQLKKIGPNEKDKF